MTHRERLEQTLLNCRGRIQEEVAALIGKPFQLGAPSSRLAEGSALSGEPAPGGRVFALVRLEGEVEGMGLLVMGLRDAIRISGLVIMLPEVEQQSSVAAEAWSKEIADTFAEVVGIVCSALSAVFQQQFSRQVHFLAAGQQVVPVGGPMVESSLPAGEVLVLTLPMGAEGCDLGDLTLALPAPPFGLERPERASETGDSGTVLQADLPAEVAQERTLGEPKAAAGGGQAWDEPGNGGPGAEVLLFSDDPAEDVRILEMLQGMSCTGRVRHFKDSVHDALVPGVRMVVLVMREVSEQGLGVAIKLASAGLQAPLVAAGPAWTRSLVLQAVKYGVRDILMTPVAEEDLRARMAAAPKRQVA
jgi:hypothetical protein